MPLMLTCDELERGMRLTEAVVSKGMVMLPEGKVLTPSDIDALKRRFPWMSVRVADPILDDMVEFEDDSSDRKVAHTAQSTIAQCMSDVYKRHATRMSVSGGGIDFAQVRRAVSGVMQYLKDNPVSSALLTRCFDASDYLTVHAGNTFYLCMLLGSALGGYVACERQRRTAARLQPKSLDDLTPLGLGAMFADICLAPLAPFFGEDKPLSDSEREVIWRHPTHSTELLPDLFPALAKTVIRTHHEKFDGSGYPGQIGGDALHVFTRIVRIADAFGSATSNTFSQARSPARALWEMSAGPHRRFYDPMMMTMFRRIIQPFPIGAKLRLTDGRYAVVVRHNRDDPFDPTVIVAFDTNDKRLPQMKPPAPLDESGLTVKSFEGEDLSYLSYAECDPAAPPTKFRALFDALYP